MDGITKWAWGRSSLRSSIISPARRMMVATSYWGLLLDPAASTMTSSSARVTSGNLGAILPMVPPGKVWQHTPVSLLTWLPRPHTRDDPTIVTLVGRLSRCRCRCALVLALPLPELRLGRAGKGATDDLASCCIGLWEFAALSSLSNTANRLLQGMVATSHRNCIGLV